MMVYPFGTVRTRWCSCSVPFGYDGILVWPCSDTMVFLFRPIRIWCTMVYPFGPVRTWYSCSVPFGYNGVPVWPCSDMMFLFRPIWIWWCICFSLFGHDVNSCTKEPVCCCWVLFWVDGVPVWSCSELMVYPFGPVLSWWCTRLVLFGYDATDVLRNQCSRLVRS